MNAPFEQGVESGKFGPLIAGRISRIITALWRLFLVMAILAVPAYGERIVSPVTERVNGVVLVFDVLTRINMHRFQT